MKASFLLYSLLTATCIDASANAFIPEDSSAIHHSQDGRLQEWPAEKFTLDNDTHIKYALDNDGKHLYVALSISDLSTQIKMMRTGMSVFIDLKAKKKESRCIQFPIKPERGQTPGLGENIRYNREEDGRQDASKRNMDLLRIRNA
ncbi:MAG: hypothetical protein EOP48_27310, partial [Sphingobacteriales bacterium]